MKKVSSLLRMIGAFSTEGIVPTSSELAYEPLNSKETMRRSHTTQHETQENVALFSFSVVVPEEIYTNFIETESENAS